MFYSWLISDSRLPLRVLMCMENRKRWETFPFVRNFPLPPPPSKTGSFSCKLRAPRRGTAIQLHIIFFSLDHVRTLFSHFFINFSRELRYMEGKLLQKSALWSKMITKKTSFYWFYMQFCFWENKRKRWTTCREKMCFVTVTKLGTTNNFLLLQQKILLQQPNVLLTKLNILLL